MDMPMNGADPAAGDALAPESAPGGYCIEIHVSADNKFSVSVEPEQEEAGEEGTPDTGTPVDGLKGAMEQIVQIVQNGGTMPDDAGAEGDFNGGFGEDQTGGAKLRRSKFM